MGQKLEDRTPKKIVTKFEGYISGDYEGFCLSKIPFKEWAKQLSKNQNKDEDLLYPNAFFKGLDDDHNIKYRFKITVEAKLIKE